MVALIVGKLATVVTPFFFKAAVDGLAPADPKAQVGYLVAAGPVALTLFYGLMRLAGVGFAQLRDGVFAQVGQRALRRLALETFRHIHALSACAITSPARPAASAGSSSAASRASTSCCASCCSRSCR